MNAFTEKTELEVLMDLMEKAEVQGFLVTDDIMEAFPEVGHFLQKAALPCPLFPVSGDAFDGNPI